MYDKQGNRITVGATVEYGQPSRRHQGTVLEIRHTIKLGRGEKLALKINPGDRQHPVLVSRLDMVNVVTPGV